MTCFIITRKISWVKLFYQSYKKRKRKNEKRNKNKVQLLKQAVQLNTTQLTDVKIFTFMWLISRTI